MLLLPSTMTEFCPVATLLICINSSFLSNRQFLQFISLSSLLNTVKSVLLVLVTKTLPYRPVPP